MSVIRRYHFSIHPRIILELHRNEGIPFKELLEGMDEFTAPIDIEIQLLKDIRDNKVYTIGDCDNKDSRGACMGHDIDKEGEKE